MKTPNFFLVIIAFILGQALFENFDIENLKFDKPVLAYVYLFVFAISIYLLVKKDKNRSEK